MREHVYSEKSRLHGTGLFAARKIKKGEYIGSYDGPIARKNGMYVLWVYEDENAEPYGISGRNLLRYLNHSKKPNAEFDGADLYALKSIKTDAEITFDYVESDF